jgi:hypothetical protein
LCHAANNRWLKPRGCDWKINLMFAIPFHIANISGRSPAEPNHGWIPADIQSEGAQFVATPPRVFIRRDNHDFNRYSTDDGAADFRWRWVMVDRTVPEIFRIVHGAGAGFGSVADPR